MKKRLYLFLNILIVGWSAAAGAIPSLSVLTTDSLRIASVLFIMVATWDSPNAFIFIRLGCLAGMLLG